MGAVRVFKEGVVEKQKSEQDESTSVMLFGFNDSLVKEVTLTSDSFRKELLEKLLEQAIIALKNGEDKMVDDFRNFSKFVMKDQHSWISKNTSSASDTMDALATLGCYIFGVHGILGEKLIKVLQGTNGPPHSIATILLDLVGLIKLDVYKDYYEEQTERIARLESVCWSCPSVEKFLAIQLDSIMTPDMKPRFSRRMSVRSYFMDLPKVRLLEYSELTKKILNFMPEKHEDRAVLEEVHEKLNGLSKFVDKYSQRLRCDYVQRDIRLTTDSFGICSCCMGSNGLSRGLIWLYQVFDYFSNHKKDCASSYLEWWLKCRSIVCEGQLETIKGNKIQCYLFNTGLVVCRKIPVHQQLAIKVMRLPRWIVHPFQPCKGVWRVHGEPIKACRMKVTDLGTRPAISNHFSLHTSSSSKKCESVKHVFKVEQEGDPNNFIELVAYNENEKKRWMDCLHRVRKQSVEDASA